jgi:23S rRNA pseudouridine2457 synthase
MNKPYGYLSQFIYPGKGKKKLLGDLYDFPEGTMAVGRLDEDSEGLLLLTTNGKVSEKIRSKKVEKEYYVQVEGNIDESALDQLRKGVEIGLDGEKYKTKPCNVSFLPPILHLPVEERKIRDHRHGSTSWISLIISEGKNRQVRKMTASVGFPTLRLIRVRIAKIMLQTDPGRVIEVDDFL